MFGRLSFTSVIVYTHHHTKTKVKLEASFNATLLDTGEGKQWPCATSFFYTQQGSGWEVLNCQPIGKGDGEKAR
jgi:hypothetical protein